MAAILPAPQTTAVIMPAKSTNIFTSDYSKEDMSVHVDINTMLKFLGDFKDIIFKVQIGRHCIVCKQIVMNHLQPTDAGWCCRDCAPRSKMCSVEAIHVNTDVRSSVKGEV
ncbi:hypothetical protein CBL_10155 [Carabus blaptoides fortunei]